MLVKIENVVEKKNTVRQQTSLNKGTVEQKLSPQHKQNKKEERQQKNCN